MKCDEVISRLGGPEARVVSEERLGGRSTLMTWTGPDGPGRAVLLQARSDDPRECLPLEEEAALLGRLARERPQVVPGLVWFEDASQTIATEWVSGERLGDRHEPRKEPNAVLERLRRGLAALHAVSLSELPPLSRKLETERLVARLPGWAPPASLIPAERWRNVLSFVHDAAMSATGVALLHGDPHAFNLLLAPGRDVWIDFEYAALGPPEHDLARMHLLTSLQAGRPVGEPRRTRAEAAFELLLASEWLRSPPPGAGTEEVEVVHRFVHRAAHHLRGA